jgi:hypothetical protein
VVFGGSPFEDELNDELLNEKDWKVDCWFDILNLLLKQPEVVLDHNLSGIKGDLLLEGKAVVNAETEETYRRKRDVTLPLIS